MDTHSVMWLFLPYFFFGYSRLILAVYCALFSTVVPETAEARWHATALESVWRLD